MKIGSNIEVSESELAQICSLLKTTKEDIFQSLTLPNPEYSRVMRFGKQKRFYSKIPQNLCYLQFKDGKYILPRFYFSEEESKRIFEHIKPKYNFNFGDDLESKCRVTLRDYQEDFMASNADILNHNGVLLEAPCGHGKTLLGIWLSYCWYVKTLILVPTYYLAKQWKSRIEEFTNTTAVIVKSADSKIPTNSDFTIVVLDLFMCRKLPDSLIKSIGLVILDEAHRIGAESYMPILNEIPSVRRLALTATFRRNDGVHKILKYHFGEHFKMDNRFPKPNVYALKTGIEINGVITKNKPCERFINWLDEKGVRYTETKNSLDFSPSINLSDMLEKDLKNRLLPKNTYLEARSCIKRAKDMPYVGVDTFLNENSRRRKIIIKLIQKCLDSGRTILFLSKRKDILRTLHKHFSAYNPMLIVSETTERSPEEEHYLQTSCRLIFGVVQLAKEGLDIDRLDTLIIHLPMKDTEQAIGRISRICKGKQPPIAFYLLDSHPIVYSIWKNALNFIKINGNFKKEISPNELDMVLELESLK